jgi:hypothetical protein
METVDTFVDTLIISANFGLIPSWKKIPYYNLRMTKSRAGELRKQISQNLMRYIFKRNYQDLFISVGKSYLPTIELDHEWIPKNIRVTISNGTLGKRQAMLHNWLYNNSLADCASKSSQRKQLLGAITVDVNQTVQKIHEIALRAVAEQNQQALMCQAWYVEVNGHHISPKWLVNQLTGMPVGAFHTDKARSILHNLGIEVLRV